MDAGWRIGSGHVMRCLTIASALREAGIDCTFLCRAHDGHMGAAIERAGFPVRLEPVDPEYARRDDYAGWRGASLDSDIRATVTAVAETGAEMLIVDHYGLDAELERALRAHVRGIVVLDDLYDKPHDCDVLIDQNIGHRPEYFDGLVPSAAVRLVGADFAPLRQEFAERREAALARRANVEEPRTLLVAVGGSDSLDVTSRVLDALDPASKLGLEWVDTAHIVLAGMAPHLPSVRARARSLPMVRLHVDSREMPDLMVQSDLAIGGSGVTAIERCVLGLPTLIVIMAENQEGSARRLERLGASRTLGHGATLTAEAIAAELVALHVDRSAFRAMIEAASVLCDGLGLERIIPPIVSLLSNSRS
ncbi:MAG: UDP-2,4-diacetamido-2,4,6-trideoxy-beta-L-altropyranose hydrolase [Hyphomicrobiaceae bacterium]